MSFLVSDRNDIRWGRLAGVVLSGIFTLAAGADSIYSVNQREVVMPVRFGKVVDVERDPGLHVTIPFITGLSRYPLYRQHVTIDASQANLRTSDLNLVQGGITVDFEVDGNSTSIENIYSDFRGGEGDVEHAVQTRAQDSAVVAFSQFSSVEMAPKQDEILERVKGYVQAKMDEQKWPIKILSVNSSGVRLDPKSEDNLKGVMAAKQQKLLNELRISNAASAQEAATAEGQVIANLYNKLVESGVPKDQVPSLICLKMAEDAHRINEPFAAGCFPGQASYQVAVPKQASEELSNAAPKP